MFAWWSLCRWCRWCKKSRLCRWSKKLNLGAALGTKKTFAGTFGKKRCIAQAAWSCEAPHLHCQLQHETQNKLPGPRSGYCTLKSEPWTSVMVVCSMLGWKLRDRLPKCAAHRCWNCRSLKALCWAVWHKRGSESQPPQCVATKIYDGIQFDDAVPPLYPVHTTHLVFEKVAGLLQQVVPRVHVTTALLL